jgi:hypothetical protein
MGLITNVDDFPVQQLIRMEERERDREGKTWQKRRKGKARKT